MTTTTQTTADFTIQKSWTAGCLNIEAKTQAGRDFFAGRFGAGCISVDIHENGASDMIAAMTTDRLTVGVEG